MDEDCNLTIPHARSKIARRDAFSTRSPIRDDPESVDIDFIDKFERAEGAGPPDVARRPAGADEHELVRRDRRRLVVVLRPASEPLGKAAGQRLEAIVHGSCGRKVETEGEPREPAPEVVVQHDQSRALARCGRACSSSPVCPLVRGVDRDRSHKG